MDTQDSKCVIVVDASQPTGLIVNTAAILGITLGRLLPEIVGQEVRDQDGKEHAGIVTVPVPILQAPPERLRAIRASLHEPSFADVTAADFPDLAQGCRTYDEFTRRIRSCPEASLRYLAIIMCGSKKKISRLTGNLPLLR